MLKIIKIESAINKKYKATFNDDSIVYFGGKDYGDYTIHKDYNRKIAYLQRHQFYYLKTADIKAPSVLSLFILWNFKTISASLKYYNNTVIKLYESGQPIPANPELLRKSKSDYIELCRADNVEPYLTNWAR